MKALVFHGPWFAPVEDVPVPTLAAPTDIIIRVDASTICGTDLHILKGDVPAVSRGRSSVTRSSEVSRWATRHDLRGR